MCSNVKWFSYVEFGIFWWRRCCVHGGQIRAMNWERNAEGIPLTPEFISEMPVLSAWRFLSFFFLKIKADICKKLSFDSIQHNIHGYVEKPGPDTARHHSESGWAGWASLQQLLSRRIRLNGSPVSLLYKAKNHTVWTPCNAAEAYQARRLIRSVKTRAKQKHIVLVHFSNYGKDYRDHEL